MSPLISIVTPYYNGKKHIERLLESLENQTLVNIAF